MPNKDGYPTQQELKTIKEWDFAKDPLGLVDYIQKLWFYPDRAILSNVVDEVTGREVFQFYLSTGGWSGNETVIQTLRETFFWKFFWQQSRKGGHYWFYIPRSKTSKNLDKHEKSKA